MARRPRPESSPNPEKSKRVTAKKHATAHPSTLDYRADAIARYAAKTKADEATLLADPWFKAAAQTGERWKAAQLAAAEASAPYRIDMQKFMAEHSRGYESGSETAGVFDALKWAIQDAELKVYEKHGFHSSNSPNAPVAKGGNGLLNAFAQFRETLEATTVSDGCGGRRVDNDSVATVLSTASAGLHARIAGVMVALFKPSQEAPEGPTASTRVLTADETRLLGALTSAINIVGMNTAKWNAMQEKRPGGPHQRWHAGDILTAGEMATIEMAERLLRLCSKNSPSWAAIEAPPLPGAAIVSLDMQAQQVAELRARCESLIRTRAPIYPGKLLVMSADSHSLVPIEDEEYDPAKHGLTGIALWEGQAEFRVGLARVETQGGAQFVPVFGEDDARPKTDAAKIDAWILRADALRVLIQGTTHPTMSPVQSKAATFAIARLVRSSAASLVDGSPIASRSSLQALTRLVDLDVPSFDLLTAGMAELRHSVERAPNRIDPNRAGWTKVDLIRLTDPNISDATFARVREAAEIPASENGVKGDIFTRDEVSKMIIVAPKAVPQASNRIIAAWTPLVQTED